MAEYGKSLTPLMHSGILHLTPAAAFATSSGDYALAQGT